MSPLFFDIKLNYKFVTGFLLAHGSKTIIANYYSVLQLLNCLLYSFLNSLSIYYLQSQHICMQKPPE